MEDVIGILRSASDEVDLYPHIADQAGMGIINRFDRPVLCRVEKGGANAYSEMIFHLKANKSLLLVGN